MQIGAIIQTGAKSIGYTECTENVVCAILNQCETATVAIVL